MSRFLGIVSDKKFQPLQKYPSLGSSVRLTRISMVAAENPENKEIDLTEYEDSAIMVEGTLSGDWIYEAEVVDLLVRLVKAKLTEPSSNQYERQE